MFWPLVRLLPALLWPALYAFITPEGALKKAVESANKEVRRLDLAADGLSGIDERLHFVERAATDTYQLIMKQVALILPGFVAAQAARFLMQRWSVDVESLQRVRQSLPHNPTTEMGLSLLQIADTLKNQGVQPSAERPEVREFLQIYGHMSLLVSTREESESCTIRREPNSNPARSLWLTAPIQPGRLSFSRQARW